VEYVSAKEAKLMLGISLSTVYRRARKGMLPKKLEGGRLYVGVENSLDGTNAKVSPAQIPAESTPSNPQSQPSSGQRELIINNRHRIGVAFYQLLTWR